MTKYSYFVKFLHFEDTHDGNQVRLELAGIKKVKSMDYKMFFHKRCYSSIMLKKSIIVGWNYKTPKTVIKVPKNFIN